MKPFAPLALVMALASVIADVRACRTIRAVHYYPAPGKKCEDLPGAVRESGKCRFDTCEDLEHHAKGYHCSSEPCDYFGSNCRGDCFRADDWVRRNAADYEKIHCRPATLLNLFKRKYGEYIDKRRSFYVLSKHPLSPFDTDFPIPAQA